MAIAFVNDHGPGKGKSYIDDRCVVKTKEEVDRIYMNYGRIYYEAKIRQEIQRRESLKTSTDTE